MNATLSKLTQFLSDVEPDRSTRRIDDAQKMEQRRSDLLASVDTLHEAINNDAPVMKARQTANGTIWVDTKTYFKRDGNLHMQLRPGIKALSINGKKTITARSAEEAHQVLDLVQEAIRDGSLDDSIRALYEIPPEILRKMQDIKAVNRLAKAKRKGKPLSSADRAQLERLLRTQAYRDAYDAIMA